MPILVLTEQEIRQTVSMPEAMMTADPTLQGTVLPLLSVLDPLLQKSFTVRSLLQFPEAQQYRFEGSPTLCTDP